MSKFLRAFPLLAASIPVMILLGASPSAAAGTVTIRKAVFSDHQFFWPRLEGMAGDAKPTEKAGESAAQKGARKAESGKQTAGKTASKAANDSKTIPVVPPIDIAVLPIRISDYSESMPCDSCHRLSANGMEFFLENWLKDRMHDRFPARRVELIAPNQPLLETKMDLMAYLDSIPLPWGKWLSDSGEQVIYRPHDRFTTAAARKRMDKLGGMLGASYLLLPARAMVRVTPRSTTTHRGGLEWEFDLAFWNVAEGRPEWVMEYAENDPDMDLDESLEARLDKGLIKVWDSMPERLEALWKAEPR
jgi:hypothetical protein